MQRHDAVLIRIQFLSIVNLPFCENRAAPTPTEFGIYSDRIDAIREIAISNFFPGKEIPSTRKDRKMANPMIDMVVSLIEKANAIAEKYRAETGNLDDKVNAWLESTDDETVVQNREWIAKQRENIEKAQAAIAEREAVLREAAEAAVSEGSEFDAAAAESEFLTLRKDITAKRKGLEAFGLSLPEDVEEIVSLKSRTTRSGSTGTGTSRSSFSSITVNGEALDKPTFTVAAQVISKNFGKVSAADLRNSLTETHGDVSEKYGEEFAFTHTVTGKDGNAVTVSLVAVPTENVRRRPNSETESETDSE